MKELRLEMNISKRTGIVLGIALTIVALVLAVFLSAMSAKNRAVSIEESIFESQSNIETIVQKRVDTLTQLVNSVKNSKDFEKETLTQLTEARVQAEKGNIEGSNVTLAAVAEAYPEIKTISLYENLMTTTTVIENQLSSARQIYNRDVRDYNKLFRQFPSSVFLDMTNYEKVDFPMFQQSQSAADFDPSSEDLFE